jgi:hypothetical protein
MWDPDAYSRRQLLANACIPASRGGFVAKGWCSSNGKSRRMQFAIANVLTGGSSNGPLIKVRRSEFSAPVASQKLKPARWIKSERHPLQ